MILNRLRLVALTSLLAACGGEPFPPQAGTLTGTFGGPRFELNFGPRLVQASVICSGAFYRGPVVPDANGNFILPRTAMLGVAYSSLQLEVRGRIVGDQIVATVITTTPGGSSTEQKTLTRGSKGDFSGYACAAAQP
jgi:hypothetical protein